MILSCRGLQRHCILKNGFSAFLLEKSYYSNTTILGIETSCDDTGCAVVDDFGTVLGDSLYSQTLTHLRYGGINPLVARDLHRDNIKQAVKEALENASKRINDIDAIAITLKPGLLVSLQIGVKYAKFLGKTFNKPLIPIHHMEAHALVARMYYNIPFPYLSLLISGGHCLLAVVNDVDDFYLLGESLDIAPGEVLDKAARRMKLRNIPEFSKLCGGLAIETAAKNAINPTIFELPLPLTKYRDCNFSFSGLQDAFTHHLQKKEKVHNVMGDSLIPEVYDLCAALQIAMAEHIAHRTERAILYCNQSNIFKDTNRNIVVSGGVACNNFIFDFVKAIGNKTNCSVYRPPPAVCTDNGVMIAWNGIEKLRKGNCFRDITTKDIEPTAPLGKNCSKEIEQANIRVRVTRYKKLFMNKFNIVEAI